MQELHESLSIHHLGRVLNGVGVDAMRRSVLELLLLPLSRVEGRGKGGYLAFVDALLGALERQEIGQFLDLPIEPRKRFVLA